MIYAVITGDLVNSSQIEQSEKKKLIDSLKKAFSDIKSWASKSGDDQQNDFDIFRGDSFQGVLSNPLTALKAGIFIRAAIRENQPAGQENSWDARLAIGLGTVDLLPKHVSEGDGPAFRNSGPVLDELKGDYRFAITTPWGEINNEFKASCALLDAIIAKWTPAQAEIVWLLLQDKNAQTIAGELDISPAAVHYRVKGAGWFALETFLERYNAIIQTKLNA